MSAALAVAGFLLTLTEVAPGLGGLLLVAALTGLGLGIPLAVGVAILRHRLYEIDRIISRSLVYAVLRRSFVQKSVSAHQATWTSA